MWTFWLHSRKWGEGYNYKLSIYISYNIVGRKMLFILFRKKLTSFREKKSNTYYVLKSASRKFLKFIRTD